MPLRNCGKQKCLGALRKLPVQRRPPLVDRPREPVTHARRGGPDRRGGRDMDCYRTSYRVVSP